MSVNLKPYYDAALAADAEKQSILTAMDAAFNDGTEEGKTKALELRPALDVAEKNAKAANDLYVSMRDASHPEGSVAANFVPDPKSEENKGEKILTLADFNALEPKERLAFSQAGGRLVD